MNVSMFERKSKAKLPAHVQCYRAMNFVSMIKHGKEQFFMFIKI